MRTVQADKLHVKIFETAKESGECAARDIQKAIEELLHEKAEINMIFAAAPSQNYVLAGLLQEKIEWNRIHAYHMDEYIGLDKDAPQGFGNFLKSHIFGLAPFRSVEYIDVSAKDPEKEAERYESLIRENPPDIIVMGIGENGHIAFNDPPVADFQDSRLAKPVKLDEVCRNQQVHDGCFRTIDEVPTHAISLTVPVFKNAPKLFCIVPYATKAEAVYKTIYGDIGESCPATVMRRHDNATLYLDAESAKLLK